MSGKIIDEHDKTVLEFATVYIVELNRGAVTDSSGNYKIGNICNGNYTVKISHIGCESIIEKILINEKTIKNFYPEHHAQLLKGVEVTAIKPIEQTTQTKTEVSEEKLNQYKGQSLGDALRSVTGINTLNTGQLHF
ncbi:MAG: carboxypeptidase-like regulatory domain-containing protein [Bacteroidetes bacterium]|nr:carboxypeptidase-like regulatory domain-containing protein [Bacteroidota bacterium]